MVFPLLPRGSLRPIAPRPIERATMDVADLLTPDRVVARWPAADKARLLAELARRAAEATGLSPPVVRDALAAREVLGSTGVGSGLAIPHARIAGLDRYFGLFARLERPIAFDAVDDEPVDLVFLLLVPANAENDHLQALASVSRRLRIPGTAALLRTAENAAALYRVLAGNPDDRGHHPEKAKPARSRCSP